MSFAVSLSLLGLVAIAAPMVASVLVALFPRPYAKWFSVLGAAVSTACTIALAANFAGAGMPDTQVPLISFGQTLVMGFTFDRMSTLLAPAFVGIGLLVVIYSIPYMSENNREHPDASSLLRVSRDLHRCHGRPRVQLDPFGPARVL